VLANPTTEVELVHEASSRARRLGRPVLASWTRPCLAHDPISFYAQASRADERVLWLRPASGEALVGSGAARTLIGTGADRFQQVDAAWRELSAEALVDDPSGSSLGGPLLLGGFSFDPLRRGSSAWAGFPDARLVLPERMLVMRDGAVWLTTNVVVEPDQRPTLMQTTQQPVTDQQPMAPGAWKSLVDCVARGIRGGQLGVDKVVLARAVKVQQPVPTDPVAALRCLADAYPSCTIFAVGQAGVTGPGHPCDPAAPTPSEATFLGATPERLIVLHAGTASTMALAGSISRGATPLEDEQLAQQLLRDPKERAEHDVVVAALCEGLAEVCTRAIAHAQPRVERLANVQHLLTPIRGQVPEGRTVLNLVERLHPTPAVGGYPTARALELIRNCESLDRGWYAGPIGWVNARGEGEFVVAIRSALVRGNSATLFAGCGIVADSVPSNELAESEWKLRPMLAALGAEA
jgi:isochorismate synthase